MTAPYLDLAGCPTNIISEQQGEEKGGFLSPDTVTNQINIAFVALLRLHFCFFVFHENSSVRGRQGKRKVDMRNDDDDEVKKKSGP